MLWVCGRLFGPLGRSRRARLGVFRGPTGTGLATSTNSRLCCLLKPFVANGSCAGVFICDECMSAGINFRILTSYDAVVSRFRSHFPCSFAGNPSHSAQKFRDGLPANENQ